MTSDDKESSCNLGDWVRLLGWEDPLEGKALQPPPVFLPGESPGTEEPGRPTVNEVAKSQTQL